MPISKYNHAFGGKKGSAQEVYENMIKEYGEKKGKAVFYATVKTRERAHGGNKKR